MNLIQKWTNIAFGRSDLSKIEELADLLYREIGIPTPQIILFEEFIGGGRESYAFAGGLEELSKVDVTELPDTLRAWTRLTNPALGFGIAQGYLMEKNGGPKTRLEHIVFEMLENYQIHLFYPLEGFFLYWDKPLEVYLNDEGQIHRIGGPAILFPRWDIFVYRNVEVGANELLNGKPTCIKEKITIEDIMKEQNADHRRFMIERYGVLNMLDEFNGKLIEEDDDYALYSMDNPRKNTEPARLYYILMRNFTPERDGSRRQYIFETPPECQTIDRAVTWYWGLDPDLYSVAYLSRA